MNTAWGFMLGELALPVDTLEAFGDVSHALCPQFLVCKLEMMTNAIVSFNGVNRRTDDVNRKGLCLHYCRRAATNQLAL